MEEQNLNALYESILKFMSSTKKYMKKYLDSGNDIVYPKSAAKIAYMTKRLEEDGFTSYWL